jgi:hypothetical protein
VISEEIEHAHDKTLDHGENNMDLYARLSNLESLAYAGVPLGTSPVQTFATAGAATMKAQAGLAVFSAPGAVFAALSQPLPGAPSPTSNGQDGIALTCLDVNGQANSVTTAANGINSNKHVATDGGTIGNFITFRAFNGTWYSLTNTGFTLS